MNFKKFYTYFYVALMIPFSSFSQQTVGLFENDPASLNGYTLFNPGPTSITYLIDNCGNKVHEWQGSARPGLAVYLQENGNLLRTVKAPNNLFQGGGAGGGFEILDWNSNILWEYTYSSLQYHHHHDVAYLPNGNVLLIAWESRTAAEAIQAGRDPNFLPSNELWPEHIVEISQTSQNTGAIVWEWHSWDHMIQDIDASKDNFGIIADHPELIDINYSNTGNYNADMMHFNAIDYNPVYDQIIVNSRSYDEFWIIDHSTTTAEAASHSGGNSGKGGDILYRWGNPEAYGNGGPADRKLFKQHDANWIKFGLEDAGKIMVFNNGVDRPAGIYSSVDIIDPPVDGNGNYSYTTGQAFGPLNVDWTYVASPPQDLFASNTSGATRLSNGNTLICVGPAGTFIEVTQNGDVVWEYVSPITSSGPVNQGITPANNNVFRAYRYAPDYPGLIGQALIPMGPIEGNPLPSNCQIYDELDIVINEIKPSDKIEIKNVGIHTVNIDSFWLVSGASSFQIHEFTNQCGNVVLAPGDIIAFDDLFNLSQNDGELALYTTISFQMMDASLHYVEWGSTGHSLSNVAQSAGNWQAGEFVPGINIGESIEYLGVGNEASSWVRQQVSSICAENNSLTDVCSTNNLVVPSVTQSYYHGIQSLRSDAKVNGVDTWLKAGDCVELLNNFEITIGTDVLISIEQCP